MAHEQGSADTDPSTPKRTNVWMIVAIVAIVLALIAGYGAFTYKSQVDDWEAAASETLAALQAAVTLANGNYQVKVKGGLVTKISKSQE